MIFRKKSCYIIAKTKKITNLFHLVYSSQSSVLACTEQQLNLAGGSNSACTMANVFASSPPAQRIIVNDLINLVQY
jgi:hypothetical protein